MLRAAPVPKSTQNALASIPLLGSVLSGVQLGPEKSKVTREGHFDGGILSRVNVAPPTSTPDWADSQSRTDDSKNSEYIVPTDYSECWRDSSNERRFLLSQIFDCVGGVPVITSRRMDELRAHFRDAWFELCDEVELLNDGEVVGKFSPCNDQSSLSEGDRKKRDEALGQNLALAARARDGFAMFETRNVERTINMATVLLREQPSLLERTVMYAGLKKDVGCKLCVCDEASGKMDCETGVENMRAQIAARCQTLGVENCPKPDAETIFSNSRPPGVYTQRFDTANGESNEQFTINAPVPVINVNSLTTEPADHFASMPTDADDTTDPPPIGADIMADIYSDPDATELFEATADLHDDNFQVPSLSTTPSTIAGVSPTSGGSGRRALAEADAGQASSSWMSAGVVLAATAVLSSLTAVLLGKYFCFSPRFIRDTSEAGYELVDIEGSDEPAEESRSCVFVNVGNEESQA